MEVGAHNRLAVDLPGVDPREMPRSDRYAAQHKTKVKREESQRARQLCRWVRSTAVKTKKKVNSIILVSQGSFGGYPRQSVVGFRTIAFDSR